jgi:hypothetical protein
MRQGDMKAEERFSEVEKDTEHKEIIQRVKRRKKRERE